MILKRNYKERLLRKEKLKINSGKHKKISMKQKGDRMILRSK
jgi:hypothetical protein